MDFSKKYTNRDEEKILLKKINDLISRSEKTYSVLYSHFLTPAELTLLSKIDEFYGIISFEGGYPEAERRMCKVKHDEYAYDEGLPAVLYSIEISDSRAEISHRDVLGSLMGLGIKREMIGDILVNGNKAQFFCHKSVCDYVEMNLQKIGRYRVRVKKGELSDIPKPKTEAVSVNVSSMRLDSLCGECFGLSRTKAAEAIKRGEVSVNWLIIYDTDREVNAGDKISMRGKGKAEVVGVTGMSKKGRIFAEIKKYI